ncbi:MAG: hypothetical protein F4X44_02665 [Gammaproteobacteria bacterium]|nr:hypothetical protein [Gammaproteobacteria bacterium]
MSRRYNNLFSRVDWHSVKEQQRHTLQSEIDKIDGNQLLNTSIDDLCKYFEEKFRIDVPVLIKDQIVADQQETQIEVSISIDRMPQFENPNRTNRVAGTLVEVTIPFHGDEEAFNIRPATYTFSPPAAEIRASTLIIGIKGNNLDPLAVRSKIDDTIGTIEQYLDWLSNDVETFNNQILSIATERIDRRRQKLLADQNLVASLGFPLKERQDSPKTFAAPNVRKRIEPTMPRASADSYKPEPVLSTDLYEHILSVLTNMALVFERSPSAFTSMNEEALRWHFLVQLNGHYEGQATGETFNYQGKTDILIRAQGKNIFIAECKIWRGAEKFAETIEQLLGYLSWRDTKAAIILFNRNKDFSHVIETIPVTVKSHPHFKRAISSDDEGRYQFVLSHRNDKNREMILTVMAFDVPRRD